MLTQIYEVSTPDEARAISAIGVDHIGVLVGNGMFPREQSVVTAARIAAAILPPSKLSALFLSADIALIEQWVGEFRPAIVHLGAAAELLAPSDVAALKGRFPDMPVMRSVPVTGEESVAIARSYDGIADFLLLDSHRASDRQIGAVGVTHDWTISRRIVVGPDAGNPRRRPGARQCCRGNPGGSSRRRRLEDQDGSRRRLPRQGFGARSPLRRGGAEGAFRPATRRR